jgi:drug/metabolite transporter (DMT)-like permease
MDKQVIKSDLILLIAAVIWGFAFVAQRAGMEFIGPFTYNALRFGLGSLALLIVLMFRRKPLIPMSSVQIREDKAALLKGGVIIGLILFVGSAFQQTGLVYTTAGKAGFITGLYVVIVPLLGLLFRQRVGISTWFGASVCVVGLYLLSITGNFKAILGDMYVLAGAFVWAWHVIAVGYYSPKVDAIKLALIQTLICAGLSLIVSLIFETTTLDAILAAKIPILYAGIFSAGIAFTLQIIGQKNSPTAHAAIIMSLEAVFAVMGGTIILGELLSTRAWVGCVLMLCGMILSQVSRFRQDKH